MISQEQIRISYKDTKINYLNKQPVYDSQQRTSNLPKEVTPWHTFGSIMPWALFGIIVLLTVIVRLRLLGVPLERDEGEYAYAGQLLLQGIPPYSLAYNMKLPGIYAVYALIMFVFGQSCAGVHAGLLLANAASAVLILFIGKKLYNIWAGSFAGACFAILSVDLNVQGVFANSENFVIFFVLCGILVLLHTRSGDLRGYFLSGLALGMAGIIKQHGFVFGAPCLLYIFFDLYIFRKQRTLAGIFQAAASLISGILIPVAIVIAALFTAGVFNKFWFWTFKYAIQYVSINSFSFSYLISQFSDVASASRLIWITAGITFISILACKDGLSGIFILFLTTFSVYTVCIGNLYRAHYFVLLLPAVSLLFGSGVAKTGKLFRVNPSIQKSVSAVMAAAVFLMTIAGQWTYLTSMSPYEVSKAAYHDNPFSESLLIANYIRDHTKDGDRIAVIGSEPQIYFYTKRISATGYIYTYPLVENQRFAEYMQKEMIREIESTRPEMLVYVNVEWSWMAYKNSIKLIFDWYQQYQQRYYDRVGLVEINPGGPTKYLWDQDSVGYQPKSSFWVSIYRKKAIIPYDTHR